MVINNLIDFTEKTLHLGSLILEQRWPSYLPVHLGHVRTGMPTEEQLLCPKSRAPQAATKGAEHQDLSPPYLIHPVPHPHPVTLGTQVQTSPVSPEHQGPALTQCSFALSPCT